MPVEIPEDMTHVDPAFVAEAAVHLTGEQAEKFVRVRRRMEDDTNTARMSRHRIYLESFRKQAQMAYDYDPEFVLKLVEKVGEHLQPDLIAQQLPLVGEAAVFLIWEQKCQRIYCSG